MDLIQFSDHPFKDDDKISFLSNFYETEIRYKNISFNCAEQAYQVYKSEKESDMNKIITAKTRKELKIASKFIKHRPNWNNTKKIEIMEKILKKKFNNLKLKKELLETGDSDLVYINYNHDVFWGVCTCSTHKRRGQNELGKIIMKLRSQHEYLNKCFLALSI